jgi:DNA-binding transcriptional regulator YiaG
MNIREFLSKVDKQEVATALGASIHTVRKWQQGARTPRPHNAMALVAWSHGALTLDGIFASSGKKSS